MLPSWEVDIDKPKTSPVVSDWMPSSPILAHGKREQVKARLLWVFPAIVLLDMLSSGRKILIPDVIVGADLECEPTLVIGCQVQHHGDH